MTIGYLVQHNSGQLNGKDNFYVIIDTYRGKAGKRDIYLVPNRQTSPTILVVLVSHSDNVKTDTIMYIWYGSAQHVVDHPVCSGSCLAFVDWCRVAVAGGIGAINPLRNTAGVPTFCCVDAALGHSRQAIRLQDFPQLSGAAAMMAAATPTAFQPIVEALAAIRTDNQTRADSIVTERAATVAAKASPARYFQGGRDSSTPYLPRAGQDAAPTNLVGIGSCRKQRLSLCARCRST
jgi:hypothetical protein